MIFSYTHKTDKKCDGITIQPELSFKHAVQKNITATVEKMMEVSMKIIICKYFFLFN